MKRRLHRLSLLAGALVAGLALPSAARAQDAYTTDDVNMRAGPGTGYERIATLPAGTGVDVEGCGSGWCRVIYQGLSGYVSEAYLGGGGEPPVVVEPPPVYVPPPVVVYPPYRPGWRPPPPHWRPPHRPPGWRPPIARPPGPPVFRPPGPRPPAIRPPGRPPGPAWGGGQGSRPPAIRPSAPRPPAGGPGRSPFRGQ